MSRRRIALFVGKLGGGGAERAASSLSIMLSEYFDVYVFVYNLEQCDYELTKEQYEKLGTFSDDLENEHLIKTGKRTYSFENTMYGTLGPESVVWDEEAEQARKESANK